jgi:peptide chain release factor subunit 3
MISGTSQADVGVLVVSARRGEFEAGFDKGGQTKEHALLAKVLGVQHLVVVVNKMDECGWDKARYDAVLAAVRPFLRKTCGFKVRTRECTFLPVSAFTGANLTTPVDAAVCPWYKGPTLLGALGAATIEPGDPAEPLRVPVHEYWKDDRGIPWIRGKVVQGTLLHNQHLVLAPTGEHAKVRALLLLLLLCQTSWAVHMQRLAT